MEPRRKGAGDAPASALGGARTPGAEAIRSRRAEGPGLLSRIPGMAYQSRDDDERTMEFVSAGARALTGYEPSDLVGSGAPTLASLIHPDDRDRVVEAVRDASAARQRWDLEYRIADASGAERWVWDRGQVILSAAGEVIGLEGFLTDVTERRELEEGLLRAQKLEVLGELTSSIAHDFNNLLTAIIAPIELVLDELDPDSLLARQLAQVNETAHSAAALTGQLLAFGRKQTPLRRVVDVNQVVRLLHSTLARMLPARFRLHLDMEEGTLASRVDPGHLEQVIVNLVVNARDARPRDGRITLCTSASLLNERVASPLGLEPGRYVTVSVEDEGVGIPPHLVGRIFEPFFTTKDHGTGLGLATVYGIVKQHGGAVEVRSEEGRGSTFRVHLPFIDAPVEDLAGLRAPRPRVVGTGTVLLVEGDERVRQAVAEALRRHGYRVLAARDGRTAKRRGKDWQGRIDVVVTEVVLEDRLGPDLVAELREHLPAARVLYVSGYADEDAWKRVEREPGATVLRKPFTLAQLLEAVGSDAATLPESSPVPGNDLPERG